MTGSLQIHLQGVLAHRKCAQTGEQVLKKLSYAHVLRKKNNNDGKTFSIDLSRQEAITLFIALIDTLSASEVLHIELEVKKMYEFRGY